MPSVVEPTSMPEKKQSQLFSQAIRNALADEGLDDAMDWLRAVVDNGGKMKINRIVQGLTDGEMGQLVNIGTGLRVADVRLTSPIPDQTVEQFWAIPSDSYELPMRLQARPLPDIRHANRQVHLSLTSAAARDMFVRASCPRPSASPIPCTFIILGRDGCLPRRGFARSTTQAKG
jgi:hypothetical protein